MTKQEIIDKLKLGKDFQSLSLYAKIAVNILVDFANNGRMCTAGFVAENTETGVKIKANILKAAKKLGITIYPEDIEAIKPHERFTQVTARHYGPL